MDSFSSISITTSCTSISTHIASTVAALNHVLEGTSSQSGHIDSLLAELSRLQTHVEQLQVEIRKATVLSESLQERLRIVTTSCNDASAVINKQVQRLDPETISRLNNDAVDRYGSILSANALAFSLLVRSLCL